MNINTLLENVETSRREFNKYYQILPVVALEGPALSNGWSVKDLMGHIVAWERYLIEWLEQRGPLPTDAEVEAQNELIYQRYKDWSWEEMEYESKDTFATLLIALKTLTPAQLDDEVVNSLIGGCTFTHYLKHQPHLERWAKRWQTQRRR